MEQLERYRLTHSDIKLTKRETEAVQYAAYGLRSTDIAEAMHIFKSTVDRYLMDARHKYAARNTTQLVAMAFREGIIK